MTKAMVGIVHALAIFAVTLLLVRVIHTTSLGHHLIDQIPICWLDWSTILLGADSGMVEDAQDASALVIALCCIPIAFILVQFIWFIGRKTFLHR